MLTHAASRAGFFTVWAHYPYAANIEAPTLAFLSGPFIVVKWKIALARMQDANMAATEITPQDQRSRPATRQIVEERLEKYWEMIEAQLSQHRRRQGSE